MPTGGVIVSGLKFSVIRGGKPVNASDRIEGTFSREEPRLNDEQIARLFEQHRQALHKYLTRLLSNRTEAEELVQETYVRLMNIARLKPIGGEVRALLFTMATNLARDRFRQRKTRGHMKEMPCDMLELQADTPGPDEVVDRYLGLRVVKSVLLDLGSRQRTTFLLHVVEHMSYRDIARKLGVSTKTVERDMALVFELCQSRLRVIDEI